MSIGAIKPNRNPVEYSDIIQAGHHLYNYFYFKSEPDEDAVRVLSRTAALLLPPVITKASGKGSRLQKWEQERYYELVTHALADYQIETHGYLRDRTSEQIDRAMRAMSRLLMDIVGAIQGSPKKLDQLDSRAVDQAVAVLIGIGQAIHSEDAYMNDGTEEYGPSNIAVATL